MAEEVAKISHIGIAEYDGVYVVGVQIEEGNYERFEFDSAEEVCAFLETNLD